MAADAEKNKATINLALVWFVLTAIVIVLRAANDQLGSMAKTALNSGGIFLVVAFVYRMDPVFLFCQRMPKAHRVITGAFVGLLICGHLLDMPRTTFPLARWNMFTWAWDPDAILYHEVYGERRDGSRTEINTARLFPSLHTCFYWNFEVAGEAVFRHQRRSDVYSDLLVAIGRAHNEQNSDAIKTITVTRNILTIDSDHEQHLSSEPLWSVEITGNDK